MKKKSTLLYESLDESRLIPQLLIKDMSPIVLFMLVF